MWPMGLVCPNDVSKGRFGGLAAHIPFILLFAGLGYTSPLFVIIYLKMWVFDWFWGVLSALGTFL
jgi:hypothetical protein